MRAAGAQSLRAGYEAFRNWLVETIPDQVADLDEIRAEWAPDVLVADFSMWGPITILREAVPIPVVAWSTLMGPAVPGPDAPPWGFGLAPPRTRPAAARIGADAAHRPRRHRHAGAASTSSAPTTACRRSAAP